jgi:hypothetical protein
MCLGASVHALGCLYASVCVCLSLSLCIWFRLREVGMTDEGVRALCQALPNSNLRELQCAGNAHAHAPVLHELILPSACLSLSLSLSVSVCLSLSLSLSLSLCVCVCMCTCTGAQCVGQSA